MPSVKPTVTYTGAACSTSGSRLQPAVSHLIVVNVFVAEVLDLHVGRVARLEEPLDRRSPCDGRRPQR